MESQDLKNVLKEEKTEKENETVRVHKKPMQLRDIETRSSNTNRDHKIETPENMNKYLNEEKDQIFKQPWNRLDTGKKLNRLRIFTEDMTRQNKLNKEKQDELRKVLFDACRSNKLNKLSEINYDKEECKVISIKNLEIKENEKISFTNAEVKKTKKKKKKK